MNRSRVRRTHRETTAYDHRSRLLILERLESRFYMDATGLTAMSGAEFEASDQRHLNSPAIVEFHMQLLDLQRKHVESVHVDDQLLLRVFVRDLRESMDSKYRFFSAYTAVSLDENQFQIVGPGKSGGDFWEDLDQLQEKVGGVVVSQYPNGDGHLVFELPIRAIAEGEATIQPEPLQGSDAKFFPVALYGTNDPIETTQISYKSLPVEVLPKLESVTSDVDLPKPPATAPSPTIEELPRQSGNSTSAIEPPVIQPLVSDRSVSSPATAQLEPSVVTNLNPKSDVDSTLATVLQVNILADRQKADRIDTLSLTASYFRDNLYSSLDDQLYQNAVRLDWANDSADFIRFEDGRSRFLPEADDARQDNFLSDLTVLGKATRNASATLSQRTTSQPTGSQFLGRQPSQQIIQRMLQRIEAFSVQEDAGFQWDVSYMRVPMVKLRLMESQYVSNHFVSNQHSKSSFEEIVIPRLIAAGAEFQQPSQTVPVESNPMLQRENAMSQSQTETIAYNPTTGDWSVYQRAAMEPMSLGAAKLGHLAVAEKVEEVNSIPAADGILQDEAEEAIASPSRSTVLCWIIGLVSSVVWGVRVGDRRRSAQLDCKIRRNQTTNL